jgi:hypothetical protein
MVRQQVEVQHMFLEMVILSLAQRRLQKFIKMILVTHYLIGNKYPLTILQEGNIIYTLTPMKEIGHSLKNV